MVNNELKTNLKILIDIIQKKITLLDEIFNITVNQGTLISSKYFDDNIFDEMIKEKRKKISSINELDEKFQKIYDDIKRDILKYKANYSDIIVQLKKHIQENINLKMKIQLEEEKNKQNLEKIY